VIRKSQEPSVGPLKSDVVLTVYQTPVEPIWVKLVSFIVTVLTPALESLTVTLKFR